MCVAVKAVTNRVQLRTIITYDFMLYGSRRFQGGRISRSASLTASTKTRLAIVAHSPRSGGLLGSSASNDNVGEPTSTGPRRQLAPRDQNSAQICAKWSLLSQTTIYPRVHLPLLGRLRASAPLNRSSETEKPPVR